MTTQPRDLPPVDMKFLAECERADELAAYVQDYARAAIASLTPPSQPAAFIDIDGENQAAVMAGDMTVKIEVSKGSVPPELLAMVAQFYKAPPAQPEQALHADGWLEDGGLLYRLTDERNPKNRDEINVTMADGSRSVEARSRRARELLDRIRSAQPEQAGAGDEVRFTKNVPVEQGWYWHWNGDEDCRPLPTSVLWSGTTQSCFVSTGQLGLSRAIDCDKYGGYWLKLTEPWEAIEATLSAQEQGGAV